MDEESKTGENRLNHLKRLNNHSEFAKALGFRITDLSYGYARSELDLDERHLNWLGTVHGGAIWSLADHTVGALGSVIEKGAVNIQTSFSFISMAPPGQRIISEASLIKETSKTLVAQVEVKTEDDRIIGVGIVTGIKL